MVCLFPHGISYVLNGTHSHIPKICRGSTRPTRLGMFQQPLVTAHDFDHRFAHRQVIRAEHLQHLSALVHQVWIGAVTDDQLHLAMGLRSPTMNSGELT